MNSPFPADHFQEEETTEPAKIIPMKKSWRDELSEFLLRYDYWFVMGSICLLCLLAYLKQHH